jgi:hypothetical protein
MASRGDDDDDDVFAEFDDDDEAEDYRRPRARNLVVKGIAVAVIFALLLAFPLGYVLETELRDGRVTAALVVTEVTVVVALVLLLRSTRRRF